uniref:Uncharacterized protein n=1 Tax=Trichuris muris TaxID=70415 RepID=A0A5S6QSL1_TRIMR
MQDSVVELLYAIMQAEDASKFEEACSCLQQTLAGSCAPLAFDDFRAFDLMIDLFLERENHKLRSIILPWLINGVSDRDSIAERLLDNERFVVELLQKVRNPNAPLRPLYGSLTANLSRRLEWCERLSPYLVDILELISVLGKPLLDSRSSRVDIFTCILVNLTQLRSIRGALLPSNGQTGYSILNFIPCIKYGVMWQKISVLRIMHNCCMDPALHRSIVSIKDPFITELVYPFIGECQFTESECAEIYPEWHIYLTLAKERESNFEFRMIALEALYQLCNSAAGRVALRSMGVYYILREYHKWETNEDALDMCERTVGFLIQTEEEINCDILTNWAGEQDAIKECQSDCDAGS